MEQIMCDLGYRNIGFPCLVCSNKILGFVITLLSMIKVCFKLRSGDILIIQYPLKKYYYTGPLFLIVSCLCAYYSPCSWHILIGRLLNLPY